MFGRLSTSRLTWGYVLTRFLTRDLAVIHPIRPVSEEER